jgi:AcrR family transcriptional regulator
MNGRVNDVSGEAGGRAAARGSAAMRKNRFMATRTGLPAGHPASQPSLGLRERKKIKLRQTMQAEALRLFLAQGYEQTTVEQIAEAAETSTTTFYRYFPTKEDVVLDDDFDALIEAAFASRPASEPLADSFRAVARAVVTAAEADQDFHIARLRLMDSVPALQARYASENHATAGLFARALAGRVGRPADDYQVELTTVALTAVVFAAARRWAAEDGATPISVLIGQAITAIEPLLAALETSSGTSA